VSHITFMIGKQITDTTTTNIASLSLRWLSCDDGRSFSWDFCARTYLRFTQCMLHPLTAFHVQNIKQEDNTIVEQDNDQSVSDTGKLALGSLLHVSQSM